MAKWFDIFNQTMKLCNNEQCDRFGLKTYQAVSVVCIHSAKYSHNWEYSCEHIDVSEVRFNPVGAFYSYRPPMSYISTSFLETID